MRRLLVLVLLAGCAHKPGLPEAVDGVHLAMRAAAVAADGLAQTWSELVDARVAHCRAQALPNTEEARAQCMGPFGEGDTIEADLAAFAAAYDEAAPHLEQMRSSAKRIDAFIQGVSQ